MDLFNLENKVAIVTGGTKGLGQGMVEGLCKYGADIVCVGRSDFSSTKAIVEGYNRKFLGLTTDVSKLENLDYIVNETLNKFGKIDILVNNSGIIRRCEALSFEENDWDDVLNVNLKAAFFLSKKVAKVMVCKNIHGKIINTASMLSYQGGINVSSYTAAKSGIMGITKILANEWGKYGINVNGIAPGYMATQMTLAIQNDSARNKEILDRIPMGRWGNKDDMQGAVVFLASKASDYVTGFTVAVDGGFLSR